MVAGGAVVSVVPSTDGVSVGAGVLSCDPSTSVPGPVVVVVGACGVVVVGASGVVVVGTGAVVVVGAWVVVVGAWVVVVGACVVVVVGACVVAVVEDVLTSVFGFEHPLPVPR